MAHSEIYYMKENSDFSAIDISDIIKIDIFFNQAVEDNHNRLQNKTNFS